MKRDVELENIGRKYSMNRELWLSSCTWYPYFCLSSKYTSEEPDYLLGRSSSKLANAVWRGFSSLGCGNFTWMSSDQRCQFILIGANSGMSPSVLIGRGLCDSFGARYASSLVQALGRALGWALGDGFGPPQYHPMMLQILAPFSSTRYRTSSRLPP